MLNRSRLLISLLLVIMSTNLFAQSVDQQLGDFKKQWANIKYQVPDAQKLAAMESLVKRGDYLVSSFPQSAEVALWQGTALSTFASLKGGLGALSAAKKAKKHLEHALSMDPRVEQGQAHVILGALYAKVPAKPLGFGDKDKAQYHLQTAMSMDPHNLDAYYFYGEYLTNVGDKTSAKKVFEKGLNVAKNTSSELADKGRRKEIQNAMASVV